MNGHITLIPSDQDAKQEKIDHQSMPKLQKDG
jgi:hypothetical protein